MTFDDASRQYADLRARVQAGRLTQEQFFAAVAQLRVQDQRGVWWQLHPDGHWLFWDGQAWQTAPTQPAPTTARRPRKASARAPAQSRRTPAQSRQAPAGARSSAARTPLAQRSQRWFDIVSILGGGAAGTLWYLYSSIRSEREGTDIESSLIMALLPVAIVVLRGPLDRILALFDPLRRRIPRIILIGAGLAAPFVVATLLYGEYTEYPYLRISTVVGTLVSYLLIRTPVVGRRVAPPDVARPGGAQ